jgi:hypothetical protein
MSDYFDRIEMHLLDAVEREARHHAAMAKRPLHPDGDQAAVASAPSGRLGAARSWLRRRPPGLLALLGVLVLSGSAAGAVLLTGQHSRPLAGVVPPYNSHGNISVAGLRYEIQITPSLQAGTIGWCNFISFKGRGPGGGFGGGGCPTGTPAVGAPLFGADGERGEGLWYVLAAPQVAAVRVLHGPTVLTRSDPRLPYGYRAAVFELSAKAFAHVGPPLLTALDASGRPIPGGTYEQPPREPTRSWSPPQRPAPGACSLGVRRGAGLVAQQGTVLTAAIPDPGIIGHAFLACANLQLSARGSTLVAVLLLDAAHPGSVPAALPNMRPMPGNPGFYERDAADLELPPFADHGLLARRVGATWLLLIGAHDVRAGVSALRALDVGPLDLRLPHSAPHAPARAECPLSVRPLAGLQEVSQTAFLVRANQAVGPRRRTRASSPRAGRRQLGHHEFGRRGLGRGKAGRGKADHGVPYGSGPERSALSPAERLLPSSGPAELADCSAAGFYFRDWPLSVTVLLHSGGPGMPRLLKNRRPVPGHPGLFTIPDEYGTGRDTLRRAGRAWLQVEGGASPLAQLAVVSRLRVTVARSRPEHNPPPPFADGLIAMAG